MVNPPLTARYALSFTSGSLMMREALIAAPIYLREHDWMKVRHLIQEDNLLQARTASTGHRLAREVAQRLEVLSDAELELLVEATSSERSHLMWMSACRRYELIGDFAEEVVRERYLLLTPTLAYEDFDSFIRSKKLWHDELAELKDSTLKKLRANAFRMLQETELLSNAGRIIPAVVSERIIDVISGQMPSDLRFFPTHQHIDELGASH